MKIIYKDGTVGECPQEEELHVLRHTAAHIMAQAIKRLYPQGSKNQLNPTPKKTHPIAILHKSNRFFFIIYSVTYQKIFVYWANLPLSAMRRL